VDTVVPVAYRLPLLQSWLKLRHCLQSHVGKTLGAADEVFFTQSCHCNYFRRVQLTVFYSPPPLSLPPRGHI